jgi:integrase
LRLAYRRGGKLIRESSRQTDSEKARDLLRQRQQMVESGSIDPLSTRVDDRYDLVKQDYQLKQRASLDDLDARWKHHLRPFFGGLFAYEVKSELVTHYQQKRLAAGAKAATINRETAILRRAYKLGLRNKRVLADHVPYFDQLAENNVRKGFVEPNQYDALVREFNKVGLWMRALFECAYTWGFRRGELVISEGKGGLRVKQVDFMERVVRLEVGTTKNGEGREVPMTTTIYELLRACCEDKGPEDYVFTREDGTPVHYFRRSWRTAVKTAGMPDLLLHDLRRSAVRVMVRSGINQAVAQEISGHKTASVFQRYNITSKRDKADAMQKREAYLARVTRESDGREDVTEKSVGLVQSQSEHNQDAEEPTEASSGKSKLLN